MPKISVIMGVYNIGDGSKAKIAIQSILDQSFKDFEFIICDDGSKDDTYNIIKEITKLDKRILVIKNEKNMGLAYTLNHCLENASGEFIARMDDDDYSYRERFEKQINFLEKNSDIDIVSSAIDIFNGERITHKQAIRCKYPKKEDFLWGSCFVHPATMFRKDKLIKVGGYRIAKETRRAEDYDLFMRMYANGSKGYSFEESLLRYYVNPIAMKKRKYKFRIDEVVVRFKGFKNMGILIQGLPYIVKPLLVGLMPNKLILKIQKNKYRGD